MNLNTSLKKLYLNWFLTFIMASIFLSFSSFKSESNDSKYYTNLVERYHAQNWEDVLTPKWGTNYWGFAPESYMRDQLPGQVIMGVALSKLGIPASQSLHILGMAFQVLSILLIFHIAFDISENQDSCVLLYSLLLTPLAFSYNIRANHELGIMFFSLLALYSGLMLLKAKRWYLTSVISSVALLWIKGPFFIYAILLLIIGFIFSKNESKKITPLILALLLSGMAILLSGFSFEVVYKNLTHESFFTSFWQIQFQQRALELERTHSFIVQKLLNFYYYFSHYLAYSMPWFLLLVILFFYKIKNESLTISKLNFLKSRLSLAFLSSALIFCFVFSLFDRIAGRYVFPGYYLFSAWVILTLFNYSKEFQRINIKIKSLGLHIVVPILWLLAFVLHFV